MTITIELSDDLANRAEAAGFARADLARFITQYAAAGAADIVAAVEGGLDPDLDAALEEAAADLAAGRVYTLEEADATLAADIAQARERLRSKTAVHV
jgi:predicted transcriptional regulator